MLAIRLRKLFPHWAEIRSAKGRDVAIAVMVGILSLLLVLGVMFLAAIPVAVKQDHDDLVKANTVLKATVSDLRNQLSDRDAIDKNRRPSIPRKSEQSSFSTEALRDYGLSVVVEIEDLVQRTEPEFRSVQKLSPEQPKSDIGYHLAERYRQEIKEHWITGLGDRAERLRIELAKRNIRDSLVDGFLPGIRTVQQEPLLLKQIAYRFREMLGRL